MTESRLTVEQCVLLACLLEATAPKPGNVHRGADFEEMTFVDFQVSAVAVGPILGRCAEGEIGGTVLRAVEATRDLVGRNTNLGLILLLAPLAAAARHQQLRLAIVNVLNSLSPDDSRQVYQAIRLAAPGGLGTAPHWDIADQAPTNLLQAMRLAAPRDLVARQYCESFRHVFQTADWLGQLCRSGLPLIDAIVRTHVRLMAEIPDTLIARKCGPAVAQQSAQLAADVLRYEPDDPLYVRALSDLDFWLRCDGHRRNPGTTADILGGAIFVGLCENQLPLPSAYVGSRKPSASTKREA